VSHQLTRGSVERDLFLIHGADEGLEERSRLSQVLEIPRAELAGSHLFNRLLEYHLQ
jgi:hypothetical protein